MELRDVVTQLGPWLDVWLERQRDKTRLPGMQVAVRVGDDLLYSRAFGVSNAETGEPLTTEHLFHVASHSKTFTATAIFQLIEAGKLRLDDTVAGWIEELAGTPMADVTVRELLGHQSGVNRDGADSDYWQLRADFPGRERLLEFASADAVFAPNEYFKYSNIGYSLLGLIIEAASGEPYDEYVTAHIVEPLGLTRTGPEVPADRVAELAGAHTGRLASGDDVRVIPDTSTHAEAAATGFYSTAEEITAYMVKHAFGRDELVSDASKRLMQRKESRITRGGERFHGLGMQVREINDRTVVGHSGGWPGHITMTWLDPKTGLCVSVLTNSLDSMAAEWCGAIIRLIDFVEAAEKTPAEPAAADPASFAGTYAAMWGRTDLVVWGTRLYEFSADALDVKTMATPMEIVDVTTLREKPEDSYGSTGEDTVVTRDADGRVTSIRSGGGTIWPIEDYRARRDELHRWR